MDALGIILVDKSQIRDEATLGELMLDEEDVNELFGRLERTLECEFPAFFRNKARSRPRHVSLPMIVDLVMLLQPYGKADDGKPGKP